MSQQLQNEDDVLSAVRLFLNSSINGRGELDAMTSLVAATSRLSLINLDSWERKLRTELWASETPSSARWKFWKRSTRFVSWLDLCSGDGFRRESALRALSGRAPNGFLFSLAMRRLNDWVPQVRAAAAEHLPLIAKRSDPEDLVDVLWATLTHCSTWMRMGDAERGVLADLISIDQVAATLKSRIVRAATGPTTKILAQAGRTSAFDQWLSEIATNAVQPSVRAKAYRCQLEGRIIWVVGQRWEWTDVKWCKGRFVPILEERSISEAMPFVEVLKMALADRSPIVRRVAGDLLLKRMGALGAESVHLAQLLASDPSPSLAKRGQFALAQLSGRT